MYLLDGIQLCKLYVFFMLSGLRLQAKLTDYTLKYHLFNLHNFVIIVCPVLVVLFFFHLKVRKSKFLFVTEFDTTLENTHKQTYNNQSCYSSRKLRLKLRNN